MDALHIPEHIAIIMDGNGRWAQKRGLPRTAGHKQGAENIRKIAIACSNMGVKALTVYAFSTENWKRPTTEIDYLCKLPKLFFNRYLTELIKNNIQVVSLGEIEKFPSETQEVIRSAVEKTAHNTGMHLCLAVNYGSRREIVLAAQYYAEDRMKNSDMPLLDEAMFNRYLMTADLPEVDLMIRTSGELRISNFLLWQIAYAELIFTDVAWPDFDERQLQQCIEEFNKRNRRFGGLSS
ncbi:isoprenyl transferase [Clostridiaceae bacterium DONG20-135]|uniref:Isoprenyl transferase n=1 Tax=Copranaerobaculum intestinale TaxID=2692629 RepID=A0A6N8UDV3_9FIRM|nr:isoprenyl transferase [Copranaerobaculum intestinale]MXQ73597.1 isoprenyl transferase [Copranaerobaculum intestinale]